MKITRYLCSVLLVLAICGTVLAKVTVDWDKNIPFPSYKTYTWGKGTPVKNPLMDQRIIEAIDRALASKGFQKVSEDQNPDVVVIYHAAIGEQAELNTTNMGGWGARWGGGMATTTIDKIPVGQLVVDIGDAKTKKLLWLGNASDTLSDNPDKNVKKLNKAVDQMFKKFPPPIKK